MEHKISDSETFVLDALIIDNVKRKIKKINNLQGEQFEFIKGEGATQSQLVDFIKTIQGMENVDLDY